MADRDIILTAFAKDLSVCTEEELAGRWTGPKLKALEKLSPGAFDSRVRGHNPIYYITEKIWFDNDPNLLYKPFHVRICDELLEYVLEPHGDHTGTIIQAQRDSFKSTISHGSFIHWFAFRHKHLHKLDTRIALIHHKEAMASAALKLLRSKSINSVFLKAVWPEFASGEDWGTALGFDWPCKHQGRLRESSVTAAGLGTRLVGSHFDLMVFDDIVTDEHAWSQIVREDAKNRYNASLHMLDTKSGKQVITGTPYHLNDIYARLEKTEGYRKLFIRAGGTDYNEPLSFPTRHTQAYLDRKKKHYKATFDEVSYWLQYQLERKSSSILATDESWLKYVKRSEVPENTYRVVLCDPAWKGTKNAGTGCYAAIAVIGLKRRGVFIDRYLLDLIHSNELTGKQGSDSIFELMRLWTVRDVGVEESGGYAFRTSMQDEARSRGVRLSLLDFKSRQTNKELRIVTYLKTIEEGNFYIVEGCRNVEAFKAEFVDYPQTDRKDILDACAYSCDPSVTERIPVISDGFEDDWIDDDYDYEPQRTLHCAF